MNWFVLHIASGESLFSLPKFWPVLKPRLTDCISRNMGIKPWPGWSKTWSEACWQTRDAETTLSQ